MYAPWERTHYSTDSGWIYADASAHRIASDLVCLIGQEKGHRVIAAGDRNIFYGYGEHGSRYWGERYRTFFDRMEAIQVIKHQPQRLGNLTSFLPRPDSLIM